MMMTFCNNSTVHPFLGSSDMKDNGTVDLTSLFHHTSTADGQKPADVLQRTPHFSPLFTTSTTTMITPTKRDPGGIGFIDDVGGSVDGLMSCTESLGFESSDERRVDDQIENLDVIEELCSRKQTMVGSKWRRKHVRREVKSFPPPLSSLNQNGKPNFFLRPVRKDGKLELQEVKIGRPEILRAFRQDGRLRLHLIRNEDEETEDEFEEEEEEEEEEKEEVVVEEEENMQEIQEGVQQLVEEKIGEEEMEEKMEERVEGWQIPASQVGGGESFLRCHEQVSHHQNHHHHHHGHHHHHDLHVWRQHCVTIR